MLKTRLLALVAAFAVGFAPMLALAAPVVVPVVRGPANHPIQATPVITVDTTGAYVAGGGGGGGAAASTATATAPTVSSGATGQAQSLDTHLAGRVLNVDAAGNVLDPNAPNNCGPTSSFIQCATKAGQPTLDANGAAAIPESVAPVVTKTTLVANTSTTICPTATHPVSTEIYLAAAPASLGIGLKGQSLTTDAWGTGSTAADYVLSTVGVTYTSPVAYSTAITGRSTGTPSVTCVQTLRQ